MSEADEKEQIRFVRVEVDKRTWAAADNAT